MSGVLVHVYIPSASTVRWETREFPEACVQIPGVHSSEQQRDPV